VERSREWKEGRVLPSCVSLFFLEGWKKRRGEEEEREEKKRRRRREEGCGKK